MPSSQCAIGSDGELLPADQINFFNDPDDDIPIAGPDAPTGRGHRKKSLARLKESIEAEGVDEDGNEITRPPPSRKRARRSGQKKQRKVRNGLNGSPMDVDSDAANSDFSVDMESDESDDESIGNISNGELADNLPTKIAPKAPKLSNRNKASSTAIIKARQQAVETHKPSKTHHITSMNDGAAQEERIEKSKKRNPVYYFYTQLAKNSDGLAIKGSTYYKCCHTGKIFQITSKMNYSLTGLISNLKNNVPPMFQLYEVLKARPGSRATEEEAAIASGMKKLSPEATVRFLQELQKDSGSIAAAFVKQFEKAKGPFDQKVFEKLLVEWIVACDQPFEEVERPQLRRLLEYTHHSTQPLHVPHRTTIKTRIMKMGDDKIQDVKKMFSELKGKVSISLDAWTSSNHYAFLAIVAHYITNDGHLQELLIGFRELSGEHSGDNLAEVVWDTLVMFGLLEKVTAFVMDNASNNDTMVKALKRLFDEQHIEFSPRHSRLRCMPHTIHLAALKLLEGVGAISESETAQASGRRGDYQETVTLPLGREHDSEATHQIGDDDVTCSSVDAEIPDALDRLRKIVRAVRVSPQRRQSWLRDVAEALAQTDSSAIALMLILDVRTRWTSTHQMLRRALDLKDCLDVWVDRQCELRHLELKSEHWKAMSLLEDWLQAFRDATTSMSTTRFPMLSTVHATFRGLQDHIKTILRKLPDSVSPRMKQALIEAHTKLATYYDKFDQSPYYTWAALLDPRIGYNGVKLDYEDDPALLEYLEKVKDELQKHFNANYKSGGSAPSREGSSTSITSTNASSSKYDFTSRYKQREQPAIDELQEFWRLQPEDFNTCDPINWWFNHRSQFPRLHQLALDILSIPGSAVAVERVFSGGRDTISMRRSSLNADTISALMLLKHYLRSGDNIE